jgi:hypothetical protein
VKYLALFLVCSAIVAIATAADVAIDSSRLPYGGTWAGAGVTGGFMQYRPDGANARPSGSGTTITITSAIPGTSLIASGSTTTTTGSITAASNQLTVASPTSFVAHTGINVKGAIETVGGVIGSGATSSGNITITINSTAYPIAVVSGDTATQVRDKINTALNGVAGVVTTGIDNYANHPSWSCATPTYDATTAHSSWAAGSTGVVSDSGHDTFGVSYVDFITTVSSVNGSVLTLAANASVTVSSLPVWHEDSQAFIAANSGAAANSVIYIPDGTYRITTASDVRQWIHASNLTWRGQSKAGTILIKTGWPPIMSNQSSFSSPITITGGATKGSTVLQMAPGDASGVTVGKMIQLTQLNPAYVHYNANYWSCPAWVGHDATRMNSIMFMVTARDTASTPNTITIDHPLPIDMTDTPQITAWTTWFVSGIGFESMTFDCTGCSPAIQFTSANDCWVYDCLFHTMLARSVWFNEVTNCTVEKCDFSGHVTGYGANHENLDFYENCCWTLAQNCWFYDAGYSPFMWGDWQGGCVGNVFGYNYQDRLTQLASYGSGPLTIDINHGPGNEFNLIEGNWCENITSDGYFGSTAYNTIIRNRVTGNFLGDPTYLDMAALALTHWSAYHNVIGNIFGTDGVSSVYAGSGSSFQNPQIYRFGMPNGGNRSYSGSSSNPTSPNEIDTNVLGSMLLVGNYNYVSHSIPTGSPYYNESLGGATVQSSLYLASKPTWFGNRTWPVFDATNPGTPAIDDIPAGYRYVHGEDPPAENDTTPPTGTGSAVNSAGTTLTRTFSEACAIGTGGSAGWTITLSGGAVTGTYSSGSGTANWIYSLSRTIANSETGTDAYTEPGNGVEDMSGNDLATFSGHAITNNSTQGAPDTTPPTLTTATIGTNGTTLTLHFDEAVVATINTGWTITPSGGAATLTYSSGSGTANLVYTVNRPIQYNETGTVGYTEPGNGIEDASAGNDLATISSHALINNSTQGTDTTPPTVSSVTIGTSGTTAVMALSETCSTGAGGNGGFTLSLSGGACTATYASGSGTSSRTYNLSRTVNQGETGTYGYTQPGNGIEDTAGNDLATISSAAVTNNSTQGGSDTGVRAWSILIH